MAENPEDQAREVRRLYDFVAEQVIAGLYKSDIIDKLIEMGVDRYTAYQLIEEMEERMQQMLKRTILVLMPEDRARKDLVEELEVCGYGVAADDGLDKALERVREIVPDLIMVSSHYPGSIEFLKDLRNHPIGRRIPAFVFCPRQRMKDSYEVFKLVEMMPESASPEEVSSRVKKILVSPKRDI